MYCPSWLTCSNQNRFICHIWLAYRPYESGLDEDVIKQQLNMTVLNKGILKYAPVSCR